MSEKEYRELVLADYDKKFITGLLPVELVSPTPGGLKAESVKVCEHRFKTKDELLLRSFFNQKDGLTGYRLAIQNSSADVFRPLNKFLRDRSGNTMPKNIDLLAWLIDFEPRPYHPGLKFKSTEESAVGNTEPKIKAQDFEAGESKPLPPSIGKSTGPNKKKTVLYMVVSIAVLLAAYVFVKTQSHQYGCMVWQNSEYQPIDCAKKSWSVQVFPIDQKLVDNFKKITRPDTLTPHSIGKVFYAKYKGRVEFFTSGGSYPLDSNRRLLPMTDHILDKYVYHTTN